jgi:hypothetical protein
MDQAKLVKLFVSVAFMHVIIVRVQKSSSFFIILGHYSLRALITHTSVLEILLIRMPSKKKFRLLIVTF